MIALDTNVVVRYLVGDDPRQTVAARTIMDKLTPEEPGFICREVVVELVWVLERAYGFSRDRVAGVLHELVATRELYVEAAHDVIKAAAAYRRGGAGFADRMIAAAARRSGANAIYTFDQKVAQIDGITLIDTTTS